MLVISNHRLETVIAHGVTSEVWSAVRLGPGGFAQSVALKTLTPHHAGSPAHVRAFLNEARAAAHVHHPHIVQTHEVIEEDGRYWLSMELVRGWTLRALIATLRLTRRMMPLEVAVALVRDAAAGVHAIHESGLLHRNLTPDNVMASESGHATILDFGSAAWKLAEQVRFTAPLGEIDATYASPQMAAHRRVDARTDVYSLGAVLHELIAGDPPPSSRGPRQVFVAPSSWRPDLPPALEGIITRALEPEPMVRFASALELAQALDLVAIQHRWGVSPSHVATYLGEVFSGHDSADPRPMRAPARRSAIETPTAGVPLAAPRHAREESRADSMMATGEHETNTFVRPAPPPLPPRPARATPPRHLDSRQPAQTMRAAPPPVPAPRAPLPTSRAPVPAPARSAATARAVMPRPVAAPIARPAPAARDFAAGSGARRMAAHELSGFDDRDDDDPDPDAATNPHSGTMLGKTRVRVRRR